MPTITVLSWNIENLGKKKREESNGEIFSLIARTIHVAGASLVGLLEMSLNVDTITRVRNGLVVALQAETGNVWHSVFIPQQKKESILILWDTTKGFSPVPAGATLGPGPHYTAAEVKAGLTKNDASGKWISFPTEDGTVGGHPAGYCTFRNDASPHQQFTYVAFHAPGPGGSTSRTATAGVQLAQAREFAQPRVVLGSDFNVDLDENLRLDATVDSGRRTTVQAMYGSLEAAPVPGMTRRTPSEKTSLIKLPYDVKMALLSDDRTVACRASKYDHIFEKGLVSNPVESGVIDMLEGLYAGEKVYKFKSGAITRLIRQLTSKELKAVRERLGGKRLSKREIYNIALNIFPLKSLNKNFKLVMNEMAEDVIPRPPGPLHGVVSNYRGRAAITTHQIAVVGGKTPISTQFEGNGHKLHSVFDRWLFYRYLVSDHLPVWLTISI